MAQKNQNNTNVNLNDLISSIKPVPALLLIIMLGISASIGIIVEHLNSAIMQILAGAVGLVFIIIIGVLLLVYAIPKINQSHNNDLIQYSQYSKPIREIVRIYKRNHKNN